MINNPLHIHLLFNLLLLVWFNMCTKSRIWWDLKSKIIVGYHLLFFNSKQTGIFPLLIH